MISELLDLGTLADELACDLFGCDLLCGGVGELAFCNMNMFNIAMNPAKHSGVAAV